MEGSDGVARLLLKRRRKFDGPVRAEITQGKGRLLSVCDYCRTFLLGMWLTYLPGIFTELYKLKKHCVPTPLEKYQVSVRAVVLLRSVSVSAESKESKKARL